MIKQLPLAMILLLFCFCVVPASAENAVSVKKIESTEINNVSKKENDYPFGFIGTVVVALIGLVGGIIGSVVAPWVNWGIEKRRLKHARKVELIKEWRLFIEHFSFNSQNFGNTTVYAAMRPFMDEDIIKKFEAQRTIHIPPDGGRGKELSKQWASDQVAMIENKWNLL